MSKISRLEVPFPVGGVNKAYASEKQPYPTSVSLKNVRPYDVAEKRLRGGQRPGLKIAFQQNIGNSKPIVAISQVTVVEVS